MSVRLNAIVYFLGTSTDKCDVFRGCLKRVLRWAHFPLYTESNRSTIAAFITSVQGHLNKFAQARRSQEQHGQLSSREATIRQFFEMQKKQNDSGSFAECVGMAWE
ncbi:hypothetical protein KR51_00018530 [Rubidibacter lacunae KORDI 51-2]|uniref:Uncharacterized protein n=1 Tax=Rubidibacter lacunae KORDI 51-2 TaxID=582515 RepID=U5DL88_9CHRO|nr:hypothetical protein KR51_00018530 [Rubidibacter lacunae KORDI 51-2]